MTSVTSAMVISAMAMAISLITISQYVFGPWFFDLIT